MPWRKGNRLVLVPESEAPEETASIYGEVKAAFGVQHVPMMFQAFAAHPRFLALLWDSVKPLFSTRELFQLAGRLRAEIYTRVHNYFQVPSLEHFAQAPRLLDTLEVLAHVDPVVLLLLAAQQQSFEGPVGRPGIPHPADRQSFSATLEPVDYDTAPPDIRKIYDEMRRLHSRGLVDDTDKVLARFPQFFGAYWQALRSMIQSPLYEPCQLAVREAAWGLVRELPVQVDLEYGRMAEHGLSATDIAGIVRLTEVLAHTVPGTLLDESFARIALEGGNRPRANVPVIPPAMREHPKNAA